PALPHSARLTGQHRMLTRATPTAMRRAAAPWSAALPIGWPPAPTSATPPFPAHLLIPFLDSLLIPFLDSLLIPHARPRSARRAPCWRQGWADSDPYASSPIWPGHPGYATRNAGLRRLSKLTWRAAEVSAVIAVGFAALFARTAQSATSHAGAQQSAKPSIHA